MIDLECWKQKIPVSLVDFFGDDHTARFFYMELLMMAAFNDDGKKERGPRKGQCFFSIRQLSKRFRMSPNGGHQVIKRLTLKYKLISVTTTDECSICTLLNYDNITGRNDKKKSSGDTQGTVSGTKSQLTAISAIKENINNKENPDTSLPEETQSKNPLPSSAVVSPLHQQVIELGLKQEMYFVEARNIKFATLENQYPVALILDKADDMFTWLVNNKGKPNTATLKTFLKRSSGGKNIAWAGTKQVAGVSSTTYRKEETEDDIRQRHAAYPRRPLPA